MKSAKNLPCKSVGNVYILDSSRQSANTPDESMTEKSRTINQWYLSFEKAKDFDSWGQLVEAADEYAR